MYLNLKQHSVLYHIELNNYIKYKYNNSISSQSNYVIFPNLYFFFLKKPAGFENIFNGTFSAFPISLPLFFLPFPLLPFSGFPYADKAGIKLAMHPSLIILP